MQIVCVCVCVQSVEVCVGLCGCVTEKVSFFFQCVCACLDSNLEHEDIFKNIWNIWDNI